MIKEITNEDQLSQVAGGSSSFVVITSGGTTSVSQSSFAERLAAFRARAAARRATLTVTSQPRVDTTSGQTVAPRSSFSLTSNSSGNTNFSFFARTSEFSVEG